VSALTYAEWRQRFPDGETAEQVVDRLVAEQPDLDAEQLAAIAALVVSATTSDPRPAHRLPTRWPR
jgi:hypothetical protein